MRVFFTPVGNYGLNTYDPYARLIGENGHQSIKWPNLTMKIAIIKKAILDKSFPCESSAKNICQI